MDAIVDTTFSALETFDESVDRLQDESCATPTTASSRCSNR